MFLILFGRSGALLGAIVGDIAGSPYENQPVITEDFPFLTASSTFTDDTVLTLAVAESILIALDYRVLFREFFRLYPDRGYGDSFKLWAISGSDEPYGSFGNGSAMRVSPVGFAFDDLETVLDEATKTALVTHDHPEGIRGAQATAAAVFLARLSRNKEEIKNYIETSFSYNLDEPIASVRKWYSFDTTCQGTVPYAIRAFLESKDYISAVRKAVSLGGDADTLACIAGGIAHAYYRHIPRSIVDEALRKLDDRLCSVVERFCSEFSIDI